MSDISLKPDKNKPKLKKGDITNKSVLLFTSKNYILLIIAVFTLFLGFFLLSGGGSDGYDYSKEIFSLQRRLIAPIILIAALILCFFSIMTKK